MRTGLTQQEKTTEIYFDEKDPTIFIRTHNTDLKNRLTAYSRKHPAVCKLTGGEVTITRDQESYTISFDGVEMSGDRTELFGSYSGKVQYIDATQEEPSN